MALRPNLVWSATMTTRWAHFIMARNDSRTRELVSLRPSGGDSADAEDGDVGGDAVQHALGDGAELDAEARIEVVRR